MKKSVKISYACVPVPVVSQFHIFGWNVTSELWKTDSNIFLFSAVSFDIYLMWLYLSFSVFRNAEESLPGWENTCDEELFRMGISTQETCYLTACTLVSTACLPISMWLFLICVTFRNRLNLIFVSAFHPGFVLRHWNYYHLMLKMLEYAICFIAFDRSDWLIVIATGILYGWKYIVNTVVEIIFIVK
jgi:hypothetical protein